MPQVGDVVELLTRRSSDEGWLFVRHAGRSGLVPIAFLVLESAAAAAPPAAPPTAAPAAPPTAAPAAPLAASPAAPAAAPSAAPTDVPPAAVDQPSTPRAGLRKLWGGGAKLGLPQPTPGAADADAAPAAPAAPAPSTAPLGASGSSTNVPRCTSSFGRMLRKVSSFERKKEKPPSLRSGSQSARGRTSSGEVVGSAQCD